MPTFCYNEYMKKYIDITIKYTEWGITFYRKKTVSKRKFDRLNKKIEKFNESHIHEKYEIIIRDEFYFAKKKSYSYEEVCSLLEQYKDKKC